MNDKARNNNKPWLTKGILKSCKKKNKLYRDFVKYRTVNAENKYKAYKNKLTTIMRCAKKDYYTNLLMENKSNIKNMWKVLREVIGSKMNSSQPVYLMNEQNVEISGEKMADEFNSFLLMLVQILPKLYHYIMKIKAGQVKAESCNPFFLTKLVRVKLLPLPLN